MKTRLFSEFVSALVQKPDECWNLGFPPGKFHPGFVEINCPRCLDGDGPENQFSSKYHPVVLRFYRKPSHLVWMGRCKFCGCFVFTIDPGGRYE